MIFPLPFTSKVCPLKDHSPLCLTTTTLVGPNNLKLDIEIKLSETVGDLKGYIAQKSQVEPERQRLIYSGTLFSFQDVPQCRPA